MIARDFSTTEGKTIFGRYRIEGRLGEGAMAEVFRAHDPDIGRTVAIKLLKAQHATDPVVVARFTREARAAGALNHANIATIYDVGEVDGTAYIAMELVEGRPLDEVLHASGRMPYERVLVLARQLADALGYAHRAGIIHRDVKPSNILVAPDGSSAKLLDFGVARVGDSDPAALARTQVGQMIGTPRYMSPEQALGLPVDHRSDLFSLGVVLYEMVTGKIAFPGTALATLAIQIAQEKVAPIDDSATDCPAGLRAIIDRLLAKKPDQRFADGAALVAALDRELATEREPASNRRLFSLRVKLPLALVGVTALALVASVNVISSRETRALETMASVSGETIAAFVTGNAALTAAENAGLPAEEQDWTGLQAFIATAARDPGVEGIVVADVDGVVRAASNERRIGRLYRSSAQPAKAQDALKFVRPIEYAGGRFGTLELTLDRTALDSAIETSRALLIALAVLIMGVALLVGYLSGAMVSRPLRQLRQALDAAARGDFSVRLANRRRDEFGAAFDAFNRAAAEAEARALATPSEPASLAATRIAA